MTRVWCPGLSPQGYPGYNAHENAPNRLLLPDERGPLGMLPAYEPYHRDIDFITAIHNPPTCRIHDLPYLTRGGMRVWHLAEVMARRGLLTECSEWRFGGSHGCDTHGWTSSSESSTGGGYWHDGACPVKPIAEWIARRHIAEEASLN
jgi:hypothetical protein